MELLFEIIFEIIFEGSIELSKSIHVPLAVRILLVVAIAGVYIGLGGLVLYQGIKQGSGLLIGIALFILIMAAWGFVTQYKEYKRKNS